MTQPEPWLRGSVEGFEPLVMPIVHALMQVREDLENLVASVPAEHVWQRPGGAASIGFHIRHLGGALDRLLTYARGEMLSETQTAAARSEGDPGDLAPSLSEVAEGTYASINHALDQLRATSNEKLLVPRKVGRGGAAEYDPGPVVPRGRAQHAPCRAGYLHGENPGRCQRYASAIGSLVEQ